jgi:hypothetical protein
MLLLRLVLPLGVLVNKAATGDTCPGQRYAPVHEGNMTIMDSSTRPIVSVIMTAVSEFVCEGNCKLLERAEAEAAEAEAGD